MKKCLLPVLLCLSAPSAVLADEYVSVQYDAPDSVIVLNKTDGTSQQCVLTRKLEDAAPKFNWNQRVILLNNTDYVSVDAIQQCAGGKASPSSIPEHVGFVVDVNLEKKLYLSLDFVSVGVVTYAATVAKLGSKRPLGNFPGEYTVRKSVARLQEEGITYMDSSPGRISVDGRYVSADGSMECATYSHPGVWDLRTGKRVIRTDGCENLFPTGG